VGVKNNEGGEIWGESGMVILEEDHCGCFLGAWLWAVGYSYPSVFSCFQLNGISAFSSQFLVSLSLQFKYLLECLVTYHMLMFLIVKEQSWMIKV